MRADNPLRIDRTCKRSAHNDDEQACAQGEEALHEAGRGGVEVLEE